MSSCSVSLQSRQQKNHWHRCLIYSTQTVKLTHGLLQAHESCVIFSCRRKRFLTALLHAWFNDYSQSSIRGQLGLTGCTTGEQKNHGSCPGLLTDQFHWLKRSVVLHVFTPTQQSTIRQQRELGLLIEPRLGAGKPLPRLGVGGLIYNAPINLVSAPMCCWSVLITVYASVGICQ